eukprot:1179067-Prorocentrum_minimum.AAC.2
MKMCARLITNGNVSNQNMPTRSPMRPSVSCPTGGAMGTAKLDALCVVPVAAAVGGELRACGGARGGVELPRLDGGAGRTSPPVFRALRTG